MPHAALWVVQPSFERKTIWLVEGFNAARGFVGGATNMLTYSGVTPALFQCRTRLCGWCNPQRRDTELRELDVSMPHAALWVVQRRRGHWYDPSREGFNAARGFVGGATTCRAHLLAARPCFNAARGFVGGATICCR